MNLFKDLDQLLYSGLICSTDASHHRVSLDCTLVRCHLIVTFLSSLLVCCRSSINNIKHFWRHIKY